jgi:hypothetical protein
MFEVLAIGAPVIDRVLAVPRVVAVEVPTVYALRSDPYALAREEEARVKSYLAVSKAL